MSRPIEGVLVAKGVTLYGTDGLVGEVGFGVRDDPEMEATARRLAACWNACEGIRTEALEAGLIAKLVEVARENGAT